MKATLFIVVCALYLFSQVNGYTVVGNKIFDPNGNEVLIRGMDRPSLEWNKVGEHISLADYTLMRDSWGANAIRVSLNQDWWLSDSAYRATVVQQADWIVGLGVGCIFDLHWNNGGQQLMADTNSITFWTQMAQTFADEPWVIFELYNEPHDVSWSVWRNGGSGWAGMQQLYDAVRGPGGANNLVIVCGLNWAFDLSGVGNGYRITGTNIAYGSHPYDYGGKQPSDWPAAFGYLAPTDPIILTEFGQYCNAGNYVANLLQYADDNGLHWTAWAWYVNGCQFPSVISDWTGTPYPGVGETVKAFLGGTGTTGSGSTTGSATTGPPPASSTPLTIYSDSIASGFESWSWGSTPNFASTTRVHSGSRSVQQAVGEYGAIYFHSTSNFYLGSYGAFDFWVYPETSTIASNLFVILYGSSTVAVGSPKQVVATAGQWNRVTIQTSQFGISIGTLLSGVAIQINVGSTGGNVYVDDVQFTAAVGTTDTTSTTGADTTTAANDVTTSITSTTANDGTTAANDVTSTTSTTANDVTSSTTANAATSTTTTSTTSATAATTSTTANDVTTTTTATTANDVTTSTTANAATTTTSSTIANAVTSTATAATSANDVTTATSANDVTSSSATTADVTTSANTATTNDATTSTPSNDSTTTGAPANDSASILVSPFHLLLLLLVFAHVILV